MYRTRASDPDFALERKSIEEPVSDFGRRLLQDFPSIMKSEVRDITFNLLRSAAHAASLAGGNTSTSASKRHVKVTYDRNDRKATLVKRPPATNADLQPIPAEPAPAPSSHDDTIVSTISAIPVQSPQERLDRLALWPVRPYALGAPRPWADSTSPEAPISQPPLKIPRLESPEANRNTTICLVLAPVQPT